MKSIHTFRPHKSVKSLTQRVTVIRVTVLLCMALLAGCSTLSLRQEESCKSRAYLQTPLQTFLSKRFPLHAPVRTGIIPFSTAANLSGMGDELPGLGDSLARKLKLELLASGELPIVEVLNRPDWSGKKNEFHHGNFVALNMARHAGFDIVVVGYVEPIRSLEKLTAHTKIIEVESGITVWNGQSTVGTDQLTREDKRYINFFQDQEPYRLPLNMLIDNLAACIVQGALSDDVVPG